MNRFWHITLLSFMLLFAKPAEGQPLSEVKHFGTAEGLKSPAVNCLTQDRDGFIWIGSNMGLTRFDGIHFRTFPIEHRNEGAFALQPRSMAVDSLNRIWINTRRGLFVFDAKNGRFNRPAHPADSAHLQWEHPVNPQILNSIDWQGYLGGARAMLTDREGGTWIGSFYEGLFYLNPSEKLFHSIAHLSADGKPLIVRPICATDGHILVGTENSGLYTLSFDSNGEALMTSVPPFLSDNIQALAADGDRLWIGTFGQGLYRYNLKQQKVEDHFFTGNASWGLTHDYIVCLMQTGDGNLWVGTTGGLFVRSGETGLFHYIGETAEAFIHALAETDDGTVWAGSLNQPLKRIVNEGGAFRAEADSAFSHPCVTSLLTDNSGNLWIGTDSKGVWRRKSDGTYHTTLLSGKLLASSANTMMTDNEGRLWVATFNGLFCMDSRQRTVSRYSQTNGLPSDFFSYGSACVQPDGQMLMGTLNGLVAFTPQKLHMSHASLRPFFTNVRIGDSDTIVSGRLTLNYDAPSVSIDYAAPTYAHQSEVWYRYRVDDGEWTVIQGGDGRIFFSHLSPGSYRISLQAGTNPNIWEGPVAEMLISVSPPWWRTGWACLFYALLFAGMAAMLWRLWRHQAERKALRLQISRLMENKELMRSTAHLSPYALIKDIAAPHSDKTEKFMKSVDGYLDEHVFDSQLSVDGLAYHMNMSTSTFYRRLKATTSMSPNEYIRLFRLKKAAVMLRQGQLPIREVSQRLCYSSVAYFTNCFTHQFGVTPGEYVKRGETIRYT